MSYDQRKTRTYIFANYDYGAAAGARVDKIVGPKGKAGRLIDYGVLNIVENFAGATTPATIAVGTTADPDAYGDEFSLAGGTTVSSGQTVQSVIDEASQAASWAAVMLEPDIPANTPVWVTNTEATGSPAGQGQPYLVIAWDD